MPRSLTSFYSSYSSSFSLTSYHTSHHLLASVLHKKKAEKKLTTDLGASLVEKNIIECRRVLLELVPFYHFVVFLMKFYCGEEDFFVFLMSWERTTKVKCWFRAQIFMRFGAFLPLSMRELFSCVWHWKWGDWVGLFGCVIKNSSIAFTRMKLCVVGWVGDARM